MNIFERFIKQEEDEFNPLVDSLEPYEGDTEMDEEEVDTIEEPEVEVEI